jgi:predicted O-linked N-acetylglucosamine transferase (SPINDLY family)
MKPAGYLTAIFAACSLVTHAQHVPPRQVWAHDQLCSSADEKAGKCKAAEIDANKGTKAATYEPSEIQRLKLENERYKLIIIALQIAPLEQQRKEQLATLNQLCETIRKENKWPDNIKCDLSTLKFAPVPPPPGAPQ